MDKLWWWDEERAQVLDMSLMVAEAWDVALLVWLLASAEDASAIAIVQAPLRGLLNSPGVAPTTRSRGMRASRPVFTDLPRILGGAICEAGKLTLFS